MKTILKVFKNRENLSQAAAKIFTESANEAIHTRGRFLFALAGGETPSGLYRLLAQRHYQVKLAWEKCFVFWGDERCVPPDNKGSNYRQAAETLLRHVSIPEDHIMRIEGERGPDEASKRYIKVLQKFASPPLRWPRFDLVLLGMGEDGHTASLFPNSEIAETTPVLPAKAQYQRRPSERVTLTEAVFNSSHHVIFLVTGINKANILRKVFSGSYQPKDLPVQRIQPRDGQVTWLVDEEAASQLPDWQRQ